MLSRSIGKERELWIKYVLCKLCQEFFGETTSINTLLMHVVLINELNPQPVLDCLLFWIELFKGIFKKKLTSYLNSFIVKHAKHAMMLPRFSFYLEDCSEKVSSNLERDSLWCILQQREA